MSARTIGEALREAAERIGRVDARALLRHLLKRESAHLIAHADDVLTVEEERSYRLHVARRAEGEPVAYITGEREFYGRVFKVGPSVLIPRPETELLVELALERIDANSNAVVCDLGTGSGCIALTLALERPRSRIVAVDRAADALTIARQNAESLGISNVHLVESDWFSAVAGREFDVVVSNPPYVAKQDTHLSQGDLRFEPPHALASGDDGLDAIRAIVPNARAHLCPGGWLLLEHGYEQAEAVRVLLRNAGYVDVFSARDLAGIERVSGGRVAPRGAAR